MKTILIVGTEKQDSVAVKYVDIHWHGICYQLAYVHNYKVAVSLAEVLKPDLFLLNFQLFQTNGIHLYDQLRIRGGLAEVPAILIARGIAREYIEPAAAARNMTVLYEHVRLSTLLDMIADALPACA